MPTTRGGAEAARVAHNHKVPGSSPGPATKKRVPVYLGLFSWPRVKTRFWDATALAGASPRVR